MDFDTSTHKARWIFDQDMLAARREEAQLKAAESLKRPQEAAAAAPAPPDDGAPQPDAKKQRVDVPVSPSDEELLRRYYEKKIRVVCEAYPLPPKVQATATAYFKRFYVCRSCLEHDPSRIMPTCIYLAAKVEEAYVGAEDFCRKLGLEPLLVLRTEVPLLQGLGFDLVVHSPHRALAGLMQELEDLRSARSPTLDPQLLDASPDALQQLRRGATKAVYAILASDAPLLYPPGVLALAALRSGARGAGLPAGGFIEHAARRAAAVRRDEAAERDVTEGAGAVTAAGAIPGGANPPPAHMAGAGSGAGAGDGEALQRLLAWMGEVDALVVSAMEEEEGLEQRATEIDRTIKLWRMAGTGAAAAAAGGGSAGGAAGSVGTDA